MKTQETRSLLQKRSALGSVCRKNLSGWLLLLPSVLLFYLIVWRPIVIGTVYSFFQLRGFEPVAFVGLKNYIHVLTDTLFFKILFNTLKYVFWSLIIGFPLPFILAVLLNEMRHGKEGFKFAMYFPCIIPGVAVSLIWALMYDPGTGGFLNMLLYQFGMEPFEWLQNKNWTIPLIVVSMTWNGFGGTVLFYVAALQGVNSELYEAARLDGAGLWQRFRYIQLPHMYGLALLMLIRQIISVFQVFEQPLLMTGGGPNNASTTLSLQSYNYAFVNFQTDKALTFGMITFIILVGLTVVYFKVDKKIEQ